MENITGLHRDNIGGNVGLKEKVKEAVEEANILNLESSESEVMWGTLLVVSAYIGIGLLMLFKLVESFVMYLLG